MDEVGARRDGNGSGKPQLSLIFDYPKALAGVTLPMLDGNKKYGRLNWRKGMSQGVILDSLLRHIQKLQEGEIFVPDSEHGATHWDAILSNALMLSELRPAQVVDATSAAELARVYTGAELPQSWGTDGIDQNGYCMRTGFNANGEHISHDLNDPCCNCPSCR